MKRILMLSIVFLFFVAISTPASGVDPPMEVWVDDDWNDQNDVNQHDPTLTWGHDAFQTILGGTGAVSVGGTVHVLAGSYDDHVVLPNSPLKLIGDGMDFVTWVDPGNDCIRYYGPPASVTMAGSADYEISGFTFSSNRSAAVRIVKANRYQDVNLHVNLHDNKFVTTGYPSYAYGLWMCRNSGIQRDPGTHESPVKIHHNVFESTSGIVMSNSDNYDIYENDFSYDVVGNGIAARKNCGIFIGSGCTGDALSRGGHHIWGNTFEHIGDGYTGTESTYPRGAIVIDHYSGRTDTTLLGHAIEGNYFQNTNGVGVEYYLDDNKDYPTDVLRDNIFDGNIYGVRVHGPYAIQILVDATCNWWGNVSGPSGNGPGSGDAVSSYVDFEPWLLVKDGECDWLEQINSLAEAAKNHGQFVRSVTQFTKNLVKDGEITEQDAAAIISWAARAYILYY